MDKIEEVTDILYEFHYSHKEESHTVAKRICQLFEPKPSGRLLTQYQKGRAIKLFIEKNPQYAELKDCLWKPIAKAQRDLTASIKDAEWYKTQCDMYESTKAYYEARIEALIEEILKKVGKRLKAVRDESYDGQTFRADLNEFIKLALKGELLPNYVVKKVGTIFVNPKFNPKYAKPHKYRHSDGYPKERHICICGEEKDTPIHLKATHLKGEEG